MIQKKVGRYSAISFLPWSNTRTPPFYRIPNG